MNWFNELPKMVPNESKKGIPSMESLKGFVEFLGKSNKASLVIAWFCINERKVEDRNIVKLYENLDEFLTLNEVTEILVNLIGNGWLQVQSDDYHESGCRIQFTHSVIVALRTGNNEIIKSVEKKLSIQDKVILNMYAYALLFKVKVSDKEDWILRSTTFIKYSETKLAKRLRVLHLDKETQSVVLYVYLMHMVEGKQTEWKVLSILFSNNRIAARRLFLSWQTTDWKPLKMGILQVEMYFSGVEQLSPTETFLRSIEERDNQHSYEWISLPPALSQIYPDEIKTKALFYNKKATDDVMLLREILKPANIKTFKQTMDKSGGCAGISVLLHGGPGTGKTELAKQLAKSTGRSLLMFEVSQQRSKFFGESEKRIKEIFDFYSEVVSLKKRTPILFFNEADSVFQNRQSGSSNTAATENAVQTILLNELEKLEGILICTTNRAFAFDEAFNRRFLMHIELEAPEKEVRVKLLKHYFPLLMQTECEKIAEKYLFTAAELNNINKLICLQSISQKKPTNFYLAIETYLEGLGKNNFSKIGFRA